MSLSEHDLRQVEKMKAQISSYQAGVISLGGLVNDLVFLRDALEVCSSEWDLKFTEKLTDLESVNSYMIEKGHTELDDVVKPIVDKAMTTIEEMIAS